MSAEDAARNVQAIRAMIAQNDTWRALQSKPARKKILSNPSAATSQSDSEPAG